MVIFGGLASRNLARSIASELHCPYGASETTKFTNDELRVFVSEKHINSHAIIVQSLSSPSEEHLVEFVLLSDALHRMGAHELIAVIPWLGYSKQDKVFRPGEPLSVKVIAKMLQVVPIKHLYTFDLHNPAILGFFDIPVTNLVARPLFEEYFQKKLTPQTVVVAPDAGSIKMSTAFAASLGIPVVYMDKKRDLRTGEVNVMGISRPVDGTDVLIIDDMIVTGSTLIEAAKFLKSQGVATISVAATHHLYVKGAHEKIQKSGIDHVVVTDTVEPSKQYTSLTVLPIAPIVAQAVKEREDET